MILTFKNITLILTSLFLILLSACDDPASKKGQVENIPPTPFPHINKLNQQITETPNDPGLYYLRAQAYFKEKGYDEAIADMSNAMQLDSTNIDYHHFLSDVYLEYNKSYPALVTIQRAAMLHPQDIPTLLRQAQLLLILKKYEDAHGALGNVFKIDPINAEALFLKGIIFREQDDIPKAINAFQTAVENDPDLLDAWIILGELHAAEKNPAAIQYFNNAVRVDSANVFALHTKANYLQQTGKLQAAIDIYRKINILQPDYTDAYFNTGLAYLELDSLDRAYKSFDIAVKTDPTNPQAYYFKGVAAEMKGQLNEAKNNYEQAVSLAPNFEQAKKALENLTAPTQ